MKRPWLAPFVPLYAAGVSLRSAGIRLGLEPVQRLAWPVISVGSISAGGAGKTPFTIALANLLHSRGFGVDILSRGYGRQGSEAAVVDPQGDALHFGDEPILIAQSTGLPVYVAAKRLEAGRLAEASQPPAGPTSTCLPRWHLLDDGFQHRQLARDVDIALVGAGDLQDSLLPAGNRREGVSALHRADILALPVGDRKALEPLVNLWLSKAPKSSHLLWWYQRKMATPSEITGPAAPRALAFCGIARPEQFFLGLEAAGVCIAARQVFRDHHRFQPSDIEQLQASMNKAGASVLVTTEKDRVRLGALKHQLSVPLYTACLRVIIENEEAVLAQLKEQLPQPLFNSGFA